MNCKPHDLDFYICESGIKVGIIAKKLGLSRSGFHLKRVGKRPFKELEKQMLVQLLSIPDDEVDFIFMHFNVKK